ncbi:MAG: hypothetical protein LQ346_004169 [Caloplaca aetnensis]|nr:MAG: hypothetical protein LQ346_004169 [Caloplaca aetnensis]
MKRSRSFSGEVVPQRKRPRKECPPVENGVTRMRQATFDAARTKKPIKEQIRDDEQALTEEGKKGRKVPKPTPKPVYTAPWLPPSSEHRSVQLCEQKAIVDLDCFIWLETAALGFPSSLQISALASWRACLDSAFNGPRRRPPCDVLQDNAQDRCSAPQGLPRLKTDDGGRDLRRFADIIGNYFFEGELRDKVEIRWVHHLPGGWGQTTKTTKPGKWLVEILDISDPGVGFVSGCKAIHVLSTVMHEKLHVKIQFHESDYRIWPRVAFSCDRKGHGNTFLEKALQLENEANRAFAVDGCRWDLNIEASWMQEKAAHDQQTTAGVATEHCIL